MKPGNLSGAVAHVKAPVPRWRKGIGWVIAPIPVAIYPGEREDDAAGFATAIRESFLAYMNRPRMTGDGLVPSGGPGSRRVRGRNDAAPKVKGSPYFPPVSKLHRHSAHCIVPMTERLPYPETGERTIPGWFRCKLVAYPFHPLHEHRTPRGRRFLASHLDGIKCPFDIERGQS